MAATPVRLDGTFTSKEMNAGHIRHLLSAMPDTARIAIRDENGKVSYVTSVSFAPTTDEVGRVTFGVPKVVPAAQPARPAAVRGAA